MRTHTLLATAAIVAVGLALALAGWGGGGEVLVRSTTTTSLYQTGLLEALASNYTREDPKASVQFIAVGSGEALRRAANGDACMVLVHAPSLERQYIEEGVLEYHRIIAFNYFIIVGPRTDPAGVSRAGSPVEALRRIYEAGELGAALFVSRGDNSGTHVKELSLWRAAGLDPPGEALVPRDRAGHERDSRGRS